MCRRTGELAASTCAKRVKSRGEAGLLRMATAIRGMPGSEFEPRRPLQNTTLSGGVFFVCASVLTVVSAGCRRLPQPTAGTLPRKHLASSAAGGASAFSSSPAPKHQPIGWCFLCAPQRSPSCQPAAGGYRSRQPGHFLESASLHPPQAALRRFPRRPLQKEYPILSDGVFFLECAAAPPCMRDAPVVKPPMAW